MEDPHADEPKRQKREQGFNYLGVNLRFLRNLRALVPSDTTLYDIKESHSKLWTHNCRDISVTEMLAERYTTRLHPELLCSGASDVGPATVFVSYVWAYKISELVDSIEHYMSQHEAQYPADKTYFWVDFLSVGQWGQQVFPTDFLANVFSSAIANIGHTLVVLLPWHEPLAFTRSWCIWEVFSTIKTNTPLSVAWSPRQEEAIREVMRTDASKLLRFLDGVRLEDSTAREKADKDMIDSAVQAEGGYPNVNAVVRARLKDLIADFLQRRMFSREGLSIEAFRRFRRLAEPGWTMNDFFTRLIVPTMQKHGGSFIDYLREHHCDVPHSELGITYHEASSGLPPNVFISFASRDDFASYVDALETYFSHHPGRTEADVSFFSDLLSRQFTYEAIVSAGMGQSEGGSTGFRLVAEAYGSRVRAAKTYISVLLPWHAPVAFTRPWILFEFCVAMQAGLPVRVLTSPAEEAAFLLAATTDFASVERAYEACCRLLPFKGPENELRTFSHFEPFFAAASAGGLLAFGAFISERYLEWMMLTVERELIRQQRRMLMATLSDGHPGDGGAGGEALPAASPAADSDVASLQAAFGRLTSLARR